MIAWTDGNNSLWFDTDKLFKIPENLNVSRKFVRTKCCDDFLQDVSFGTEYVQNKSNNTYKHKILDWQLLLFLCAKR